MISQVKEYRLEVEELCRRFGVRRLELFGSAATGAFRADRSDLDFLVEFQQPTAPGYADRYFGLLEALEELFGGKVDLVVASAIKNPYLRQMIEGTKVLLYAV